ncbi:hypothetical protein [Draconibacterium halophilum]|uniref:Uncharacterized protein n=1 Tax=Draconibacterium halophilum TaxID=2706887 RepID=A0A6C0RD72_9BACT|nr:hypothetical protein [Draconibacterium halophilum]QIA07852.1 hypothetical protein G0Q07_08975 [Draconibacterium halophilum]
MNTSELTIEEIIYESGLRINNSLSDRKVLNAVSPLGYTETKLTEGAGLLSEATTLVETQKREYGEVDAAQNAYETQRAEAHSKYMDLLAICKIAFKKDVKAISTLDLTGRRASTLSGWLKQTIGFYRAILANDEWKAALATYGQTEEKISAELAEIEAVASASENKKKEMGDAQNATQERDEKLEELAEWVNDYEVIARIALADKPQLLEKLGIVVKG